MIRYKVVTKDRQSWGSIMRDMGTFKTTYPRGVVVKAVPGTQGLFCFKTRQAAMDFINENELAGTSIIRVKPLTRGKAPKFIIGYENGWDMSQAYKLIKRGLLYSDRVRSLSRKRAIGRGGRLGRFWIIPKGTICYDKVEVLD